MKPLLLDLARLQGLGLNLRRKLFSRTGELAAWLGSRDPSHEVASVAAALEHADGFVLEAIARELLLLPPDQRAPWFAQGSRLETVKPLGPTGPAAGEVGRRNVAMAVFPLQGRSGTDPSFALLAVLEDGPSPFFLFPVEGMAPEGDSWQLAEALCREVLADDALRVSLARLWLITGTVEGKRQIGSVTIGNKAELHKFAQHRIWLVPAANYRDAALRQYEALRFRCAASLDDALNHVAGGGSTRSGDLAWSDELTELHSFVSEAKEPIIMAAMLMKRCRLVLWVTDEKMSRKNAAILRDLLHGRNGIQVAEPREVPSDDLAAAETVLRAALAPALEDMNRRILFNITQGNTLMRGALLLLARRHPNLWLIYRNQDIKDQPVFDLIRFPGSEAMTQRITAGRADANVNWDHLFANNRGKELTVPEWADYYFSETGGGDRFSGTMKPPILIGNTFPLSLIRNRVSITPQSADGLRHAAAGRPVASFWGHANTLAAANQQLGLDLTPACERPAVDLSACKRPMLDGVEFDDCWILSPDYRPGFRPGIGEEVPAETIVGWQVLHIQWPASPLSNPTAKGDS